jgi:hypothetical protein
MYNGAERCKIGLFTNDVNPGREVSAEAFTPLDADGGALQNCTFALPMLNDARTQYIASSGLRTFKLAVAPEAPVTVYGCYIVSAVDPTKVIMAQRFDAPQVLRDTEDVVQGVVQLSEPDSEIGFILLA